ncbi:MAG: MFS transporter [Firmicutes bacterium]|nr:MFS transporter [Bacillota bacterium]
MPKTAPWLRSFMLLFIMNSLMWFGVALMIPTLPLFARQLGASQAEVGYLLGGFGVAALLIRPYAGYAYDNYSKKTVLLVSLAALALLMFSHTLAATYLFLFAIRVCHGLVFGFASTGGNVIIADIVPVERRSEMIGHYGLGNTLAMSVGPAIGLFIASAYGFNTMFLSCGAFIAAASLLTIFIDSSRLHNAKRNFTYETAFEPRVLPLSLVVFIVGMFFGGLNTFVAMLGEEIGIFNGGIFFTLNSIGVAIPRLFAGRIQDRRGPRPVIPVGLCSLALGLVVLGLSREIFAFSAAALLTGFGLGIVWPAMQAMVVNMVEPGRRGVALSTYGAAVDVGIAAGAIVLGWVSDLTSLSTMYLVSAAGVIIPFLAFQLYIFPDYERKVAELGERVPAAAAGGGK